MNSILSTGCGLRNLWIYLRFRIAAPLLFILPLLLLFTGCSAKAKTARHLKQANQYFESGSYEKAEIEYINALRIDHTNAPAFRRLGAIYYDEGRLSKAFAFLKQAETVAPGDAATILKLGSIYLAGSNTSEARKQAMIVLKQAPSNAEALMLLAQTAVNPKGIQETGQLLQQISKQIGEKAGLQTAFGLLSMRQSNFPGAETAFKRAIALDPKLSNAYLGLAGLYLAQSNFTQADQAFKKAAELEPIRSATRLKYVRFRSQIGDSEQAKKILDDILTKAPDYLPARNYRAEMALAEKKYEDSDSQIKEILSRDPENHEALLLNAKLDLLKGDHSKAASDLEKMVTFYPQSPQLRLQLAQAQLLKNDLTKALASLHEAIALDPNFTDAILLLAELDIRRGDTGPAILALSKLIKQRPNILQAQSLLALGYRTRGTPELAVPIYTQLMEKLPKSADIPLFLGLTLRQLNQPDQAEKAFEKAQKLAPDNLAILNQLVELDIGAKRFSVATARCNAYIQNHPNAAEPHFLLAQTCVAQQDLTSAVANLEIAIKLSPEFRPAYVLWSQMYVAAGKHQEALAKLQKALALNSNDVPTLSLQGNVYQLLGSYEKAAETDEHILKIQPKNARVLNDLAYLYSEYLNKLDAAAQLARQAHEILPANPEISDTFGWTLFREGKPRFALTPASAAAEKLPNEPEVQYHLGVINYELDDEAAARTALSRAVSLTNTFRQRPEAEQRLRILNLKPNAVDPATIGILQDRLKQNPNDIVALARMAEIYEQKGDIAKAADTYSILLKANSNALPPMLKAVDLYITKVKDLGKALEVAKGARALAPENPDAIHALGKTYLLRGDFLLSLPLLEASVSKRQNDPAFLSDLALAYYSVGREADAKDAWGKAVNSDTVYFGIEEARQTLGLLTETKGSFDPKKAAIDAQNILNQHPENLPALMLAAQGRSGTGDAVAAKKAYEQILVRYPAFGPALKQLAFLYAQNDDKKAFELGTKAKPLLVDDPELTKFLGITAYRLENYPTAVQLLTEISRKNPSDAEAFYYLGMAHHKLKHLPEAKQALAKAISLQSISPLRKEADQILSTLK